MWQFFLGLFVGAVVGVFAAAILFVGRDGGPAWEELPAARSAAEIPPGTFPECCHAAVVIGCPSCEAFVAAQAQ